MKPALALIALFAAACVSALPEPPRLDLEAHCRLTAEGFREASPGVARRLDAAVAWAVFPEVEDGRSDCSQTFSERGASGAGVAFLGAALLDALASASSAPSCRPSTC